MFGAIELFKSFSRFRLWIAARACFRTSWSGSSVYGPFPSFSSFPALPHFVVGLSEVSVQGPKADLREVRGGTESLERAVGPGDVDERNLAVCSPN